MDSLVGIIVGILGLGFLILAHELGHFLVAKATGMRVEEFSIGYGRFILSRRIGETVYGISVLPLGGYVRVTGMHEEEFQAREAAVRARRVQGMRDPESMIVGRSAITDEEAVATPRERRYYARPLWQRLLFLISGVSMNLLVAFVLLVIVGLQGIFVPTTTVEQVLEKSPAAAAGLRSGDVIVAVDAQEVTSWEEVRTYIRAHPGRTISVVVERQGERVELISTVAEQDSSGFLGVAPRIEKRPATLGQAMRFGASRTWFLMTLLVREIGKMFTGKSPVTGAEGLAGPLGIIAVSSSAYQQGYFLSLLAFISIQLAVLNMLPLLPLDGGHVAINILQAVTRRRFSLKVFERFSLVGIGLFALLALVATGNDILRIFTRTGF